ncbi:MAG: copper chaperone PCu(A)C [Sphingobium sp.]
MGQILEDFVMRFSQLTLTAICLTAPFALVSCADPAPLYVDQAWVKLNANPAAPSAAYFTIHGGAEPVKLLQVATEGAVRVEMHKSAMKDGMMSMQAVQAVDVPAETEVKFAPGGLHLMLFDVNPAVVDYGKMTFTMVFSNGDRLIVDAPVQKAGAGGAATGGMENMTMPSNETESADK